MTETNSEFAAEAAAPIELVPAAPEPDYVVVSRDEVDEYASKGYTPGYAMLKPA